MRVRSVAIVLTALAFARVALAANPRVEAAALDALSKAEGDFLAMNYASGAARLDKALRACAPNNCSVETQAALLRDIGTMEFRAGDKGFATKAFAETLKLQPTIDLNRNYDSPDLRALWVEVKGGGPQPVVPAPPPTPAPPPAPVVPMPPTLQQPTGDFVHVPAPEQKIDTPLPVYVEGGPNNVVRVIVRFKGSETDESDWGHMELARLSTGWGGLIPCNAVVGATLRYYIQGFNKDMDPVATNGDAKNPYQVPIRQELAGPPPHLPNRPAPKLCHPGGKVRPESPAQAEIESPKDDCPPGMPGCGKVEKTSEEEGAATSEDVGGEEHRADGKKRKSKDFRRWWVGVAFHFDFAELPSGQDLCRLHPAGSPAAGQPANDRHFYCTDASGADFPARSSPVQNDQLSSGTAGASSGGIAPGNLRLMASLDYAAMTNVLVGLRAGYVLFAYPGAAAVSDSHAWGPKFYVEARVTGFVGKDPLKKTGVVPMAFLGGGVSSFDAHTSDQATVCSPPPRAACMPPISGMKPTAKTQVPVDLWITNGPGFIDVGGGVRYAPVPRVAVIGAVRLNLSFGSNGVIPTAGPEVGVQYGF